MMEDFERRLAPRYQWIAGVDEAGRGALAGPVFAAMVVLPPNPQHPDIQDSKMLSPTLRKELSQWIKQHAIAYGIGRAHAREIERLNVLSATRLAIRRAYTALMRRARTDKKSRQLDHTKKFELACLLIDGKYLENRPHWKKHPPRAYLPPSRECCIVRGDQRCYSIAAASILAKVARDQYMTHCHRLDNDYQKYGFDQNKGYGVPTHLQAIERYGTTDIHRKTFAPCR